MSFISTSVRRPDFDTGLVAVDQVATSKSVAGVDLTGLHVNNPTGGLLTFSITNGADVSIVGPVDLAAGQDFDRPYAFLPCAGLKWVASGPGLVGQLWGYLQ